jgi:ectoine hydroxylase-related dioxygenase (phytanoyl-CoA dioxygenase family)
VLNRHKVVDRNVFASLMDSKPIPNAPNDLFTGRFHETNAEPTKLKTAQKNQVYVTIALTDLSSSNGWYTFYEDSHSRTSPLSKLVALDLKAGDAVVWRGDLVYIHSSGGGGVFLTLVFK